MDDDQDLFEFSGIYLNFLGFIWNFWDLFGISGIYLEFIGIYWNFLGFILNLLELF